MSRESNALSRMCSIRSERVCSLATVKSQARKRSSRFTPAPSSVLSTSCMCGRRLLDGRVARLRAVAVGAERRSRRSSCRRSPAGVAAPRRCDGPRGSSRPAARRASAGRRSVRSDRSRPSTGCAGRRWRRAGRWRVGARGPADVGLGRGAGALEVEAGHHREDGRPGAEAVVAIPFRRVDRDAGLRCGIESAENCTRRSVSVERSRTVK